MISTDIFTIATSALNVQQGLLNTTSNNIANVNTEGYVRQRGISEEQSVGGVLLGDVERVVDRFAQEQQQRDISQLGETEVYLENLNRLDSIFASEAISAAEGMSRYFAALQDATDNPNNMSSRQIALGQAEAMMDQFNNLGGYLVNSVDVLNESFDDKTTQANDLIQQISELNTQIKATQFAPQTSGSESVKNQRDEAILELSKIVALDTQSKTDGSTLVFMQTGQSLVLEDGSFNLFSAVGDPDPNYKQLSLQVPGDPSFSIPLGENVGGELGGLVRYREEVLEPNSRDLGLIALSLSDSMNEQNKLGMDLDGQLGTDIFTTPTFSSLAYRDNTGANASVNARVPDGAGNQITAADYQIEITGIAGTTITYSLALLNADGTAVTDSSGNAIIDAGLTATAGAGTFAATSGTNIGGDLEIEFPSTIANYTAGDRFLIQPAKEAAGNIGLAINRPEDLALAAPVRVDSNIANLGSAEISNVSVTNTIVGTGNDQSAFTGNGGLQAAGASPAGAGGPGAPSSIVFTAADTYEVYDGETPPNLITTVAGATNLNNLLGQASGTAGWTGNYGAAVTDYPGYDLSIEGVPRAGDEFTIEFNTNGFNDNSNGLALAALQDADTTLQSNDGNGALISYHEAYTGIVADIGTKTATAEIQHQAAVALERQSREWVDSVSGVNLDEEAANLIRFQQAYSANARVLTTAQSLFQTILGALG